MPGSARRLVTAAVTLALTALPTAVAVAAPTPDPSKPPNPSPRPSTGGNVDCSGLFGEAKELCLKGDKGHLPGTADPLNPLDSLADGCAEAARWVIKQLSKAVNETTQVDFTNAGFLRQYAVVFAASTILTLVLWMLAVMKRAVRGVPLHEAFTEAVGFLWLTVVASAFTPLALYSLVKVTDGVTEAIAVGTKSDTSMFFDNFSKALQPGKDIGGGPIMLIVVSMVSILAAAVVWLELLIRAALLYVGALLGTAVYSGLVDKKLWGHVRRWAGIMVAVLLVKPVIVIVLGLAGAISAGTGDDKSFSAVFSGLAIILLTIFASFMIYRFVPGFGDDMSKLLDARKGALQAPAAAVINSPATMLRQGITAHSTRPDAQSNNQRASGSGGSGGGGAVSSGIAAHSTRANANGNGSAGQATATTPAPRTHRKPGGDQ
ncbi:hypothetical protein [Wenjunlia tyrosinilytica]|uniref:Integral membrane protein n=1 Tax=Wenjunlia tyrosinilytica TaxID=1544741 RepID=A0A918DY02_9ACTN|nr:hypothetical protein [Wenjunlia tyrosinilytica]GGO87369.1 hypothetical protein GCM10012280_25700 [Wenjunlia tyrosinilytica]